MRTSLSAELLSLQSWLTLRVCVCVCVCGHLGPPFALKDVGMSTHRRTSQVCSVGSVKIQGAAHSFVDAQAHTSLQKAHSGLNQIHTPLFLPDTTTGNKKVLRSRNAHRKYCQCYYGSIYTKWVFGHGLDRLVNKTFSPRVDFSCASFLPVQVFQGTWIVSYPMIMLVGKDDL
jgi:hypothetical protein